MRRILLLLAAFQLTTGNSVPVIRPDFRKFDTSLLDPSSFFEQFDYKDLKDSNWKVSHSKKNDEFAYVGQWTIEEPHVHPGFSKDSGLVMKTAAAHHAISYKFEEPFNNTDKDLVLQYEVKLQDGLKCGGTYIKLLDNDFDKQGEFSNETPYQIMFGPDKCGSNNKIHFIVRKRNKVNGEFGEKHLTSTPMSRTGKLSTLYTLIFKKNSDFEIRINGEVAKAGNFLQRPQLLNPPLNPEKFIVDMKDRKPLDWDDREFIPDPEAKPKPSDYDQKFASVMIPDPKATKPDYWDESEPEFIVDPSATKPDDWDESIDGVWIAPEIRNPICDIKGCGKWTPPKIVNENYKGPWHQKNIRNPKYLGDWKPRTIPNPDYYEDTQPSNIELVGGLGFELWSLNSGILFDNIYLGHSVKEAELIGNTTFNPKYDIEHKDQTINGEKASIQPKEPPKLEDTHIDNGLTVSDALDFVKTFLYKQYLDSKDLIKELVSKPKETVASRTIDLLLHLAILVSFAFLSLSVISLNNEDIEEPNTIPLETEHGTITEKEKIPNGSTTSATSSSSDVRRRQVRATS